MLLNWDMVISDMTVYGYGKQRNDYIYDVYRGGIEWQLKDAWEIDDETKYATRFELHEPAADRYTIICNDKNETTIDLSKMIKDYCQKHFNCHCNFIDKDIIDIDNKEKVSNYGNINYDCKCNDFSSDDDDILAMTMDFYSNTFYVLLQNKQLYRIAKVNIKTNTNAMSDNCWKVTNCITLGQSWCEDNSIYKSGGRLSIKYDPISQCVIVSNKNQVGILYMF